MGQSQRVNGPTAAMDAVDTVTNVVIVDHWGIVKADIGLRGAASPPSARPATRHAAGVDIVIGPGTEIIAGEG